MKTLILYATKYGAAGEIAQRIAKKIDGAVIHDLKQSGAPSLEEFDCVILGGSIYAGMLRKEAKSFIKQNASALCGKNLGLFLCGMDSSSERDYFNNNFPAEIIQAAKAMSFLGGIFDPGKVGLMGRLIMKAATKHDKYTDTIDNGKIEQFVEAMMG